MLLSALFGVVIAAISPSLAGRIPNLESRDDTTVVTVQPVYGNLTTCTTKTFYWDGGVPPYIVGIYKSVTGGLYLETYQNETSVDWLVDAAGGKGINIQVIDSNGVLGASGNIGVVNGSDVSCVKCAGYDGYAFC